MRKSAKVKQRDKWLMSKSGKSAIDPFILRRPFQDQKYLSNRVERAFCDGWDAEYAQGVKEALENQPL